MTVYCGRDFSPADIQTIRELIEHDPKLLRSPLSRRLCELFAWFKPNGELKDMTCRVALLRMHDHGLITLPASQIPTARRRPDFPATPASDPQSSLLQPVHEIGPLTLRLVAGAAVSRLWNEYVQRYHYLGYTAMSGSQLRSRSLRRPQARGLAQLRRERLEARRARHIHRLAAGTTA